MKGKSLSFLYTVASYLLRTSAQTLAEKADVSLYEKRGPCTTTIYYGRYGR